jgi:hypothetical protein
MIMVSNLPEYSSPRALCPDTVIHLQRLVLLNFDSRDAYRAAETLARDARLMTLAQHTFLERQIQAVTLQNILWSDGNESTSRVYPETVDHAFLDRIRTTPATSDTAVIRQLLDIDLYVCLCYEKIISATRGRGIRQLLSEQATQIDELRKTLAELLRSQDAHAPAADNHTLHIGIWE